MRELRVEDALLYLDQVKVEFGDRPHIYNEFLDIMKTFKTQQIDTPGVIRRVSTLFQGNKRLVLGFNTFLPEGYKIELPLDGDGPPIAVYRAPGQPGVRHILGPIAPPIPDPPNQGPVPPAAARPPPLQQQPQQQPPQQQQQQQQLQQQQQQQQQQQLQQHQQQQQQHLQQQHQQQQQHNPPHGAGAPQVQQGPRPPFAQKPPPPMPSAPIAGMVEYQQRGPPGPQQPRMGHQVPPGPKTAPHPSVGGAAPPPPQPPQPPSGGQAPVEFDHAINYVTTIKKRFANEPETYKKFLEILHTYQKEQRGIKEVLDEVSVLFSEHPDLLKEFTYFLPDAVQAQAKAQLDKAAKESEARIRANASKQAIMQQAHGMQQAAAQQRRVSAPAIPPPPQIPPPQPASPPELPKPFSPSPAPVPFGATQGRSEEREREICRTAIYGTVSFAPIQPARRGELSASQAALKIGRPQTIPELATQPTTAESAFFERAKLHLNRKELAPDKPPGSRRHTPYTEFLKCLHLFGAGILNKEEVVVLLRGLFMQGHAPKSGVNAGGGASNPAVANDAQELLREFEEVLVGRGHFADQANLLKDKSKYGDKQVRDFDFAGCDKPTPSYRSVPSDYPMNLFHSHSGQSGMDASVLNGSFVCVPSRRGTRLVWSPDEYDGPSERNNVYEENMFKVEDERYEVDMAIERNVMAMRVVEPIADEVTRLRELEEKDGQPIGRMHYKLRPRQLRSDQIGAIARLYGDHGDEVVQHLLRNPIAVLPIVYRRLRQKDAEWRGAKAEMSKRWTAAYEANYLGSLDTTCSENKQDLEKLFDEKKIVKELKNARSLAKHPGPLASASATRDFYPEFKVGSVNQETLIYQPYMRMLAKSDMPHKDAYKLIATKISSGKTGDERVMVARVWAEVIAPTFNFPTHWILNELVGFSHESKSFSIVKFGVGQVVVTAYGTGEIMSIVEATQQVGLRYKIALPFGIGFIRAEAILHVAPGVGNFVRTNNRMQAAEISGKDRGARLDSKFSLLFGNQQAYAFFRCYCLLVEILADSKKLFEVDETSDSNRDKPGGRSWLRPSRTEAKRCAHYATMISTLQKVLSNGASALDFERVCRTAAMDRVAQRAILPKLVEKCSDILCKIAKDQTIFMLHDYTLAKENDPVKLRSHSLSVSENACYRMQYDKVGGWMYFSFLEKDQPLLEVPEFDDDDDEEEIDEEQEIDATEDDQDEQMGEDNEGEGEDDGDDGDESDDAEEGEIDVPDAKRPKLE